MNSKFKVNKYIDNKILSNKDMLHENSFDIDRVIKKWI